ncbi:hypothetical protein J437_LFUL001350 [Ladona fulva]|uniref:Uncharacterized protein n=1 Tax=Ladona fulva TaxID=123851 RepID=A0A8K0JV73_LADFU|nr:hypothetical protein J437_LFUL001350 [Ladona fulva]
MSSTDMAADRMVSQVSEFTNTERRFRRYRCFMVAFYVTLMLSLIIYLLLTWELSEEPHEGKSKDTVTFTTILVISVSALAIVSVASFVSLECIRRKSIRHLIELQNQEMRSYYEGLSRHRSNQGNIRGINASESSEEMQNRDVRIPVPRRSRHRSNQVSQPSSSTSGQSSWIVPPASEASSPPPAYDECVL